MKRILIGTVIVLAAIAAGVGGAYAISTTFPAIQSGVVDPAVDSSQGDGYSPWGMMGGAERRNSLYRGQTGPGRMDRGRNDQGLINSERIAVEKVVANAKVYGTKIGKNLEVSEVMEFSNNFYVVLKETDSQKAAFELLVDPYNGHVSPEIGPNRMWNSKYGHMQVNTHPSAVNSINMQDAATIAQKELDKNFTGAVVQGDGNDFYGYYSFDYKMDDQVIGMLSVNGVDGTVWFHNWHGTFISEEEILK
ncbi:MAG: hypothetical protein NTZ74_10990 [Chloroflexi bacterium]|nr:hypothetical protein [Chloroflexota bacterium]